jgi:hypothetical protein
MTRTHTARVVGSDQVYRYRSLDALARRITGSKYGTWQLEHDPVFAPAVRTVTILQPSKYGGRWIICRLRVESDAID